MADAGGCRRLHLVLLSTEYGFMSRCFCGKSDPSSDHHMRCTLLSFGSQACTLVIIVLDTVARFCLLRAIGSSCGGMGGRLARISHRLGVKRWGWAGCFGRLQRALFGGRRLTWGVALRARTGYLLCGLQPREARDVAGCGREKRRICCEKCGSGARENVYRAWGVIRERRGIEAAVSGA